MPFTLESLEPQTCRHVVKITSQMKLFFKYQVRLWQWNTACASARHEPRYRHLWGGWMKYSFKKKKEDFQVLPYTYPTFISTYPILFTLAAHLHIGSPSSHWQPISTLAAHLQIVPTACTIWRWAECAEHEFELIVFLPTQVAFTSVGNEQDTVIVTVHVQYMEMCL